MPGKGDVPEGFNALLRSGCQSMAPGDTVVTCTGGEALRTVGDGDGLKQRSMEWWSRYPVLMRQADTTYNMKVHGLIVVVYTCNY